jgi:hypothetical protein
MKKGTSKPLTRAQREELKSLAALPDEAIDASDAPEVLDWSDAKHGLFYRPVKQQLTLRLPISSPGSGRTRSPMRAIKQASIARSARTCWGRKKAAAVPSGLTATISQNSPD